jgi:hypothetical protein
MYEDRPVSGTGRASGRRAQWRRPRIALALAALALLAAALAALLPARLLHATYSWPPRPLPPAHPAGAWYTPLLLARHEADSIDARIPCAPPPALPDAPKPPVVLATARNPTRAGGLAVTRTDGGLVVSVGGATIAHILLPSFAPPPGCAYRLEVTGGNWTVTGGAGAPAMSGETTPPVVSGLFSNLDLRQRPAPSVEVTTAVYASQSTAVQTVLRILASIAAVAALVLVAAPSRPRPGAVLRQVGLLDAVVVIVLLVWWVLGPAFYDDGWVEAGQRNLGIGGGLSSYYDSFAVTSSLQYWLAWILHPLFDASHALLVLRIPALACLVATWFLCRWMFTRIAPAAGRAARWTLAAAFLTGAFAWGMTLRPEPVVAVLVTGVAVCTVLFVERGTAGPLAVAVVLVALAVTAHPAGLVTLAPLLVASPAVLGWVRRCPGIAATIALACVALVAVLAVLGSDLRHLSNTAASLRAFGVENAGWRDELTRYSLLSRDLYGAPLRRLWVVLALLAVFAYLMRARRANERPTLNLPAAAVGIALLLLIVTPSKLPWHFGVLIGLAAVALAAETERLAAEPRRWQARPFLFLAAGTVAAAWAWYPRNAWADLDLRTLDWTLGVERHITFAKLAAAVPVLVLVALALWELRRRRARRLETVPWRAATWTVTAVAVPLLVFTTAVLAADAHRTSSWTLTRQNLDTLRGSTGCGLADDSLAPATESMQPLPSLGRIPDTAPWLPATPANALPTFALAPRASDAPARSPWFRAARGRRTGFFLTGIPSPGESIAVDRGRSRGGRVAPLSSGQVAADLASDARPELGYWRFNGATSLPAAPPGADALRFAVATAAAPAAGIGLTPPVTYDDEALTRLLGRSQPALATPNLLTYFPCLRLPPVRRGVAEVPKAIVAFRDSMWPIGAGTSPFDGVTDLYPLVRLPLSDSADPPDDVVVYIVDTHSPGAALAPAVPST